MDETPAEQPFADAPSAPKPNKSLNVTQVKNGFVVYAGPGTVIAYTFEELVEALREEFANV
jgi:hypothetical protein